MFINRKHKKAIAVLIALILAASALAGCGASDAGFFSLYKEMSGLKSYTVSGNMEIEYNPSVMYSYYYGYGEDDPIKLKFSVSGEVEYSGLADLYLNLKIKYGINSKDTPNEANLRFYNNVLYMPVKDYVDAVIEAYRQDGMSDRMCGSLKNAFMKGAGGYDYVILADSADIYQYMAFTGATVFAEDMITEGADVDDMLIKSFTEMFSGLDSGMTRAIPNGYAVEVTPEKVIAFIDNFYKYLSANKEKIYKSLLKLYDDLNEYGDGIADDMYIGWYSLADIASDKEYYKELFDELGDDYKAFGDWEHEYYKLLFKGSRIDAQLTKSGDKYAQDIDVKVNYRGKLLLSTKGNVSQTVNNGVIQQAAPTENPITLDDLWSITDRAEREVNYVKKAEFSWWKWSYYDQDDNSRWMSVSFELVEGGDQDYMEMFNEGGTIYVPMRQMLDWFAEDVTWDSADKKAYVSKGGEKIDMSGKIINGKTYIKIRDFEKLGYTVHYTYDADWGDHTVTIKKN